MRAATVLSLSLLPWTLSAQIQSTQYYTTNDELLLQQDLLSLADKRPKDCPPCFNCNLDIFKCQQYANCTKSSGRCACPPGFGGEDCGQPLCGSLADGSGRLPRKGKYCNCKDGWEGINCNVCQTDEACQAFYPDQVKEEAVCYQDPLVVNENHQICNITNRKILEMLKKEKPQATFSCNSAKKECSFQFWIDQKESFYCALDACDWSRETTETRNTTKYKCENIKCECIPGRMLCGRDGSVDITDHLAQAITGPATFSARSTAGGSKEDGSVFSEPGMNQLISSVFGDRSITLDCRSGECMTRHEVPGASKPIKGINTPVIAGVIAGSALFIVAVILLIFLLRRRSARSRFGPIRLDTDEEEENARLLADHKPAALYFENVHYEIKGRKILSNVTGSVHPGELLAIMGASGAGKTSFLDILARKNKRGAVMGDFWLNGEKVASDEFRSVIGFVDQDDTMLPTLTVHETILDSALLRLPKDMSRSAKEQKVEDVERQLGIYHIRHQLIGSEEGTRGISGGEKRRVGIACELVTSPSILFLDEPTSGLDAYNAFNVVECLVNLVKTYNRTVVLTIHQPRSNIVALFDQLMLLAEGRVVYSGPFHKCQSYFDSIGYACPPGFNIADYLVDLTMHAGAPADLEEEDEPEYLGGVEDGRATRASSTMAVKSIASISNVSIGDRSSTNLSARPKAKRKTSVRQQQERQLYGRRRTQENIHVSPSVRSEGDSIMERESDAVKLSKQHGQQLAQHLDDPHNLLPSANGASSNLDILVASFADSEVAADLRDDIHHAISSANESNGHPPDAPNGKYKAKVMGYRKPGVHTQFLILSIRTWRNLYRNPMLMLTHYLIAIVLACFLGFLFYGLTDNIAGFQNRLGIFFFLLALFGFSTLTSLTVFAPERLIFVRERAKGYYHPIAYYLSKVVFDIVPLRLIPPLIMGCIVYPMTGLVPAWAEFFKFLMFIVLFNLAAAMICLFIGICVKNAGVANLYGVLFMLFSLLFSGFLLNHKTIPGILLWLQQVSYPSLLAKPQFLLTRYIALNIPLRLRRPHRKRDAMADACGQEVRPRYRRARSDYTELVRVQHTRFMERCCGSCDLLRRVLSAGICGHTLFAG